MDINTKDITLEKINAFKKEIEDLAEKADTISVSGEMTKVKMKLTEAKLWISEVVKVVEK